MKGLINFEPNNYYHLVNHAVGNENLFRTDENYQYFLRKFAEHTSSVCEVLAYCLMPNHIHFLIKILDEKTIAQHPKYKGDFHKLIMQQISNLLNAYTKAYNKRYERRGALWIDYTKRFLVNTDAYFTHVIHYIHQNPVNHQFVSFAEDWIYSSYSSILSDKKTRLKRDEVLEWFGGLDAYKQFHKEQTASLNGDWESI